MALLLHSNSGYTLTIRTPGENTMLEMNRSIFRAEALQRHLRARQNSVYPRLVRPPIFLFLWIVLFLLIGGVLFGNGSAPIRMHFAIGSALRPVPALLTLTGSLATGVFLTTL